MIWKLRQKLCSIIPRETWSIQMLSQFDYYALLIISLIYLIVVYLDIFFFKHSNSGCLF